MSAAADMDDAGIHESIEQLVAEEHELWDREASGAAMRRLLELDLKPRYIMTRAAFENAMTVVIALGGSTNAVLHLIAMARSVDVELGIDDFQAVSNRTPYIADLKPSGAYVMEDLHSVGGTPAVMKLLLEHGMLDAIVDRRQMKAQIARHLRHMLGLPASSGVRSNGAARPT